MSNRRYGGSNNLSPSISQRSAGYSKSYSSTTSRDKLATQRYHLTSPDGIPPLVNKPNNLGQCKYLKSPLILLYVSTAQQYG